MFWIPTFRTCCRIVPSAGYNEALHSKGENYRERKESRKEMQRRGEGKGKEEREGRGKNKRVNKQVKLGYIIFNGGFVIH